MNFRQFFGTRMPVKVMDGILFKRNNSQTGQIDIYFLHCRLAVGTHISSDAAQSLSHFGDFISAFQNAPAPRS